MLRNIQLSLNHIADCFLIFICKTFGNIVCRIVSRTKKYQSISPVLQSLHWLPVHYRIMFKILLLSYQCFHNLAPSYLTELLTLYKPGRNLRSGKKNFFVIPPVLTKTYGERTFAHAAPIMWNNLPDSLRSINSMEHFKSALKTYLFELSLWYHEPVQCLLLTSFFLQRIETCPAKCYERYKNS